MLKVISKDLHEQMHNVSQDRQVLVENEKVSFEVDVSNPHERIYDLLVDRRWLFEHWLPHVVTYLLYDSEFNAPLEDIYIKGIAHGYHYGLMLGVKVRKAGRTPPMRPSFKHNVVEDFCECCKGDGVDVIYLY